MPFPGEERYRDALVKAEGHESMSAMVKVADLKAALDEIERLRAALDTAYDLSTWAACINWRARDKDNTGEWLDELRMLIETTQSAITAAKASAIASVS